MVDITHCLTGGYDIWYIHNDGDRLHVGWAPTKAEAQAIADSEV